MLIRDTGALEQVKSKVLRTIDEDADEAVSVFRDFVRIPSIYRDVNALKRASEFLADLLRSHGVQARLIESGTPGKLSVLGHLPGKQREKGRSLILNGHMDTYPPSKAWSMDPFGALIRDGRLYGQGADDMKAGLAAMAMTVCSLAKSDVELCGDLFFHAIPNHYNGGDGTRTALRSGLKADFAIVGEPSDLQIAVAQCGILYVNVTVTGVATHATSQQMGVHPITKAAELVQALRKIEFPSPSADPHGGECHLNISAIHAEGLQRSLVPDECRLTGDVRFTPSLGRDGAYIAIQRIAEELTQQESRLNIDISLDETCVRNPRNATQVARDAEIVQIVGRAAREILGHPSNMICHPAWPDTPVFNDMGVQAITFGPGSTACYWPDEYVEVADYLTAIKVYSLAALEACCSNPAH